MRKLIVLFACTTRMCQMNSNFQFSSQSHGLFYIIERSSSLDLECPCLFHNMKRVRNILPRIEVGNRELKKLITLVRYLRSVFKNISVVVQGKDENSHVKEAFNRKIPFLTSQLCIQLGRNWLGVMYLAFYCITQNMHTKKIPAELFGKLRNVLLVEKIK